MSLHYVSFELTPQQHRGLQVVNNNVRACTLLVTGGYTNKLIGQVVPPHPVLISLRNHSNSGYSLLVMMHTAYLLS